MSSYVSDGTKCMQNQRQFLTLNILHLANVSTPKSYITTVNWCWLVMCSLIENRFKIRFLRSCQSIWKLANSVADSLGPLIFCNQTLKLHIFKRCRVRLVIGKMPSMPHHQSRMIWYVIQSFSYIWSIQISYICSALTHNDSWQNCSSLYFVDVMVCTQKERHLLNSKAETPKVWKPYCCCKCTICIVQYKHIVVLFNCIVQ